VSLLIIKLHRAYLRWCLARNNQFRDEVQQGCLAEIARVDRDNRLLFDKLAALEVSERQTVINRIARQI
jgi:hypothetical protein